MNPSIPARLFAGLTIATVLAFLLLDVTASQFATEGYTMKRDYVSSLAARGSTVGLLGGLCLAFYALSHLLAGVVMLITWRTKVAGSFLVLAAVLFGLVVLFRADCTGGEVGCGLVERGPAGLETGMHGVMAGTYALVMFVTMLMAAVSAFWERGATRVAGLIGLPLFWLAFSGIGAMNKSANATGAWERLWLYSSVAWLVAIAVCALVRRPDHAVPAGRRTP